MASFFTATLVISFAGMVTLMVLKQIELSTGTVILARVRPGINRFFRSCLHLVERGLPTLLRQGLRATFYRMRAFLRVVLAHVLLRFEEMLKNTLRFIRQKTHPSYARGEASPFLKEVGEYKKQLETGVKEEDRAAYEEIAK
jgi:hypothetical protein